MTVDTNVLAARSREVLLRAQREIYSGKFAPIVRGVR